jgi:hypothetical protein
MSLPLLLLIIAFAGVVLAWAWSYAGTAYLDHGRLLVIDGESSEILDLLFDKDDAVHSLEDAQRVLTKPSAWYFLRSLALRGGGGAYTAVWGGFGVGRMRTVSGAGVIRLFAVPLWAAALPTGAAAATVAALRARQRQRFVSGRCARCGYDLRGSPACCPECGVVPVPTRGG